jgi:hypothetical protein
MPTKTETSEREVLPLKLSAVTVDNITHTRKYVIVEVGALSLQDFNDRPDVWRLIQQDRNKALGPNDAVELRASDWTAFAYVNSIDTDAVHLYDIRKASRPQRTAALFEDNTFRIGMVGSRYAVFHKKHGDPNPYGGKTFETVKQAEGFIKEQYPVKMVS